MYFLKGIVGNRALGAVVLFAGLFAIAETALILMPRWRRTTLGKWAESRLARTPVYSIVKRLYWQATPGLLRRWFGKSRVSTLEDVLDYPRRHKSRTERVAAVAETVHFARQDGTGYELWSTSEGHWWIPTGQSPALIEVLAEQESGIYEDHQVTIRPGDVVLDCGANIGGYTRHALNAGAKVVVAVEPSADGVECLRRNLAEEIAEGKVIVCAKGVWSSERMLQLSGSGVAAHIVEKPRGELTGAVSVALTTIDQIVDNLKLTRVDFIKMDIEGAEVNALIGAQRTLSTFKPRLALAGYHRQKDSEEIPREVLKAWSGYTCQYGMCYHPALVRPETIFFH